VTNSSFDSDLHVCVFFFCLFVCFVVALDVRREKNTSCRNREWRKRNPKRV